MSEKVVNDWLRECFIKNLKKEMIEHFKLLLRN